MEHPPGVGARALWSCEGAAPAGPVTHPLVLPLPACTLLTWLCTLLTRLCTPAHPPPPLPPAPIPTAVVREICPKGMGGAERMPVYLPEDWPEQLVKLQPGLQLPQPSGGGGSGGSGAAVAATGGAAVAGTAGASAPMPGSGTSSSDGSGGAVAGGAGAGSALASRAAAGPGRIRVAAVRQSAAGAGGTHTPLAAAAVAAAAAAGTLGPAAAGSMCFVGSPRAPLTQQQRLLGAAAVPSLNIAALQLPAPVLPPVLTVRPIGSTSAAANAVPPGGAGTPLAALSPLSPFGALGAPGLHPFGGMQLDGSLSAVSTPAPTPVDAPVLTPTTALAATLAATNFGLSKLPLAAQLPHLAAAAAMQQAATAATAAGAAPAAAAGRVGELGVESPTAVAHGPTDPSAHPSSSASEADAHHHPATGSSGTTPEPQLPPGGQPGQQALPGAGGGLLTAA